MKEIHRPKVTMTHHVDASAPITAPNEVSVSIYGKVFCLEEPSALDYNNYLIASEREDRKMLPFLNNEFLIYIKSIDGVEFKKPLTQIEITAGLMRIGGKRTMDALKKELKSSGLIESEENSEDKKEELKK